MAYGTVTFFSDALGQDLTVDYILPDTRRRKRRWVDNGKTWGTEKLKTIWVLHGNGDAHNAWIRKSNIELYARQFDVAVIMPSCGRESYSDSKRGLNYYTYVAEELPAVMRYYLPLSEKREDNFIMGNSMGGQGSLKVAMRNPQNYAAVASFSAGYAYGKYTKLIPGVFDKYSDYIFGSEEEFRGSEDDIMHLIMELKDIPYGKQLRIYQCCGTEDFLYQDNQDLKKQFEEELKGNEYVYSEGPGGHDWFYWNPEIEKVFKFFGFDIDNCWDDSGIVRKAG